MAWPTMTLFPMPAEPTAVLSTAVMECSICWSSVIAALPTATLPMLADHGAASPFAEMVLLMLAGASNAMEPQGVVKIASSFVEMEDWTPSSSVMMDVETQIITPLVVEPPALSHAAVMESLIPTRNVMMVQ
jgi:hypothetical protein